MWVNIKSLSPSHSSWIADYCGGSKEMNLCQIDFIAYPHVPQLSCIKINIAQKYFCESQRYILKWISIFMSKALFHVHGRPKNRTEIFRNHKFHDNFSFFTLSLDFFLHFKLLFLPFYKLMCVEQQWESKKKVDIARYHRRCLV